MPSSAPCPGPSDRLRVPAACVATGLVLCVSMPPFGFWPLAFARLRGPRPARGRPAPAGPLRPRVGRRRRALRAGPVLDALPHDPRLPHRRGAVRGVARHRHRRRARRVRAAGPPSSARGRWSSCCAGRGRSGACRWPASRSDRSPARSPRCARVGGSLLLVTVTVARGAGVGRRLPSPPPSRRGAARARCCRPGRRGRRTARSRCRAPRRSRSCRAGASRARARRTRAWSCPSSGTSRPRPG